MKTVENKQILSVSEVNATARETLELLSFWVEGEISSVQSSENWYYTYFTLKDDKSILPCFCEPNLIEEMDNGPVGKNILVFGRLTLFKNNEYKMRIFSIQFVGEGVLQKQFEELYRKLKSEGLFDEKHKKPIPIYPKRVCIVTSEGSAGWNDFKTHTTDKFPIIEFYTVDIRVEGPRSIEQLTQVLPRLDKLKFDVVVITRGGGAQESLNRVFNDEGVVRTIFNLQTPTIVAIGHEINVTLAELTADQRASTPTDAANIITRAYQLILEKLESINFRLKSNSAYFFSINFQKLDALYSRLSQVKYTFKDLPARLNAIGENLKRHKKHQILDAIEKTNQVWISLGQACDFLTFNCDQKLDNLQKSLMILSPTNTLKRGYSISYDETGKILKTIDNVVIGSTIGVRLADGKLQSTVVGKSKI